MWGRSSPMPPPMRGLTQGPCLICACDPQLQTQTSWVREEGSCSPWPLTPPPSAGVSMSSLSSEGDYAIPPDACSLASDYSEPEHKLQRTSAFSGEGPGLGGVSWEHGPPRAEAGQHGAASSRGCVCLEPSAGDEGSWGMPKGHGGRHMCAAPGSRQWAGTESGAHRPCEEGEGTQ